MPSLIAMLIILIAVGLLLFARSMVRVAFTAVAVITADDATLLAELGRFGGAVLEMTAGAGLLFVGIIQILLLLSGTADPLAPVLL